jgi:hypothetical protein
LLLAVSSFTACKKKEGDKPAAGSGSGSAAPIAVTTAPAAGSAATPPPAAPADMKPFEATLEGKPYKFATVKIVDGSKTANLVFTTATGGCAQEYKTGDIELAIKMEKGPGGKYFAPGPVGVDADITSENVKFETSSLTSILTVEPGEWKVGNKIKGTLRINDADGSDDKKVTYTGSGSFVAEICALPGDEAFAASPESVDKTPIAGSLGDQKFAFKGGIAHLGKAKTGEDQIAEIDLYDSAVDCSSASGTKGGHLMLMGNGGATGKDVFVGTPQQRSISFRDPGGAQVFVSGPSWVKFDTIDLKEGGDVKGSLFAESSPDDVKQYPKRAVKLAGTFAVKVCTN